MASEGLWDPVFKMSSTDQNKNKISFRKFKMNLKEVQGRVEVTSAGWIQPETKGALSQRVAVQDDFMLVPRPLILIYLIYSVMVLKNTTQTNMEDPLCSVSIGPNM